jgi:hypothetical protein
MPIHLKYLLWNNTNNIPELPMSLKHLKIGRNNNDIPTLLSLEIIEIHSQHKSLNKLREIYGTKLHIHE